MAELKKPIQVPSETGPVDYGTPESAQALASIWGMTPEKALRIMLAEQGKIDPATVNADEEMEAQAKQLVMASNPKNWSDPQVNSLARLRKPK